MLKVIRHTIVSLSLIVSTHVYAGVIEGTIDYANSVDGNTVDAWYFTLDSDGIATFDILASGVTSWIDSMIWLFTDDGTLGWDNLIAESDDSIVGTDLNGSLPNPEFPDGTYSLDPFLEIFLNSGDYVLVVGSCCDPTAIDFTEMTQALTLLNSIPYTGDYILDYSDNLTLLSVSSPQHLTLMALGLAGLGYSRKFRSRKNPLSEHRIK